MKMRENEKGESEPSGSSELCQSDTEMSGNVGGLVGHEESVQLFGRQQQRNRGAVEAQQLLANREANNR